MKFLGRAKETVENIGKGGSDDAGEGSRMKDAIGYSDKKRKIALQWDYAAWTSGAASFTDEVQKLAGKSGQSAHVSVSLSGEVSPRLRQELEKRGMTVQDRLVPGPLK